MVVWEQPGNESHVPTPPQFTSVPGPSHPAALSRSEQKARDSGRQFNGGTIGTATVFTSELERRSQVERLKLRLWTKHYRVDQSRMTSLTSWLWGQSQIDDAVGEQSSRRL